jgi:hypothetical protein
MSYSAAVWEDHCTCGYCRNFYETLDEAYPQLKSFLGQFGMNSLTPEEMSPIEPTLCMVSYCISGTIVKHGVYPIDIGGVVFTVSSHEKNPDYEPSFGSPFFVLTTGLLEIPWVLEEDMDEVISPANEPEYLERMMDRLLQNTALDSINS